MPKMTVILYVNGTPHGLRHQWRTGPRGVIFFEVIMDREFAKPPLTVEGQISLLSERGMIIDDEARAAEFLQYCAYYRFCGYALAFEVLLPDGTRTHRYKQGTRFRDVEDIYHFDGDLRRLLFHYITLIEIDFRNTFCNETSLYYNDAHWFMNPHRFEKREDFDNFISMCLKEAGRSHEIFISSYYDKYALPFLPPIWMLGELMPFAFWSRTYQNLNDLQLRKRIASMQGVPEKYLISWLQSLTVLRNSCAHHARIWNRNFYQAPLLTRRISGKIASGQHKKIAVLFLVIEDMLRKINRSDDFKNEIAALFAKYPMIVPRKMGIPDTIGALFA